MRNMGGRISLPTHIQCRNRSRQPSLEMHAFGLFFFTTDARQLSFIAFKLSNWLNHD